MLLIENNIVNIEELKRLLVKDLKDLIKYSREEFSDSIYEYIYSKYKQYGIRLPDNFREVNDCEQWFVDTYFPLMPLTLFNVLDDILWEGGTDYLEDNETVCMYAEGFLERVITESQAELIRKVYLEVFKGFDDFEKEDFNYRVKKCEQLLQEKI